jgi:uncharacterized membrane protein YkoI
MDRKIVFTLALSSVMAFAAESRVKMQDLPEAVQRTVKEQTKNAKLRALAREVENGQTFYEAETVANGKNRDVLIDVQGKVVEVEEATTLASIPDAAQKALTAAAGSGKIVTVETITKDSVVSYEAVIQKGGKKSEVAVTADGSVKK